MNNAKAAKRDLEEVHTILTRAILFLDRLRCYEAVMELLKVKESLPRIDIYKSGSKGGFRNGC